MSILLTKKLYKIQFMLKTNKYNNSVIIIYNNNIFTQVEGWL